MDLFDHPGNLGSARGTLLTIHHADWPAYPQGDDFRTSLLQLTAFPAGTKFIPIDHIDRSALFVAHVRRADLAEPFAERNFHVAVWYEDLIELDRRGFLDGISRTSERTWHEDRWRRLVSGAPAGSRIGYEVEGQFVPLEPPDLEFYDDDTERGEFVLCRDNQLTVTSAGRMSLLQELGALKADIIAKLSPRVAHLFELTYYDTCIREACVQLEHDIRMLMDSDMYGDKLVQAFTEKLRADKHLESHARTFRQELRAVFKFIRNDYMHNLREADAPAALAMLFRIAKVRTLLDTPPEAFEGGQ